MNLLYNLAAVVNRIGEADGIVYASKQYCSFLNFSPLTELSRDCSKTMVRFDVDVDCCFSGLVVRVLFWLSPK